jgi:hypothetical protein
MRAKPGMHARSAYIIALACRSPHHCTNGSKGAHSKAELWHLYSTPTHKKAPADSSLGTPYVMASVRLNLSRSHKTIASRLYQKR